MRGKLTKRTIDSLTAANGREITLWDSEVRGFGLRVRSGGAKTFILRYRPGGGGRRAPLRTYTIGRFGSPWTVEQARAEVKRLLGRVEAGADPAADQAARRDAPTVNDLGARFLTEHVEVKLKPRTQAEYRRWLKKSSCLRSASAGWPM